MCYIQLCRFTTFTHGYVTSMRKPAGFIRQMNFNRGIQRNKSSLFVNDRRSSYIQSPVCRYTTKAACQNTKNITDVCIKETSIITNQRHQRLFCHYWKPSNEKPRALVCLIHGYAEHLGLYEQLANTLVKQGCFVFGNDLFGHGRSEGSPVHCTSYDYYVDDCMQHINLMRKQYSTIPLIAIAHSMGSVVPVKAEVENPGTFNGMVLMSPLLKVNPKRSPLWRQILVNGFSRILPHLKVAQFNIYVAARDPQIQKQILEDPYVYKGGMKLSWINSTTIVHNKLPKSYSSLNCPIFVLHGEKESIADINGTKLLLDTCQSTDKTIKTYKNGGHQLYNELQEIREEALSDTITWICSRLNSDQNGLIRFGQET